MAAPLESSIVRFRKSNGSVVGAGFLVSDKHILTCAHVVADALGIARDTQNRPTEDVYLDFPLIDSETQLTARVVFWSPIPPKGSTSVKGKEDIAGLELKSTLLKGIQPVDLFIEEDLRGHSFRTFGFPSGHDDGLEATGVLRGRQGTGWVQLEDVKQTGVRLEPGFSGAPVWDEELNGVVGMAVAADQKRPEAKLAFMIPTERLATAWSALGRFTIPPLSLVDKEPVPSWYETSWRWICIAMIPILSATVLLIPQVQKGLKIGQPSCFDIARKEGKLAIAVANFDDSKGNPSINPLIEKQIQDAPGGLQRLSNVEVCHLASGKSISDPDEARQLGDRLGAAIVIWGRRGTLTLEVRVTTVKLNLPYLTTVRVYAANPSEFDLKTKDIPPLVTVMTAFALSQIYKTEGHLLDAQTTLEKALMTAKLSQPNLADKNTAQVMADAYFNLGNLYNPTKDRTCSKARMDCEKARLYYYKASEADRTFHEAIISEGRMYERLGDLRQAVKVWSQIIKSAPESEAGLEVRVYRADIYLNQGRATEAVEDLEFVCQNQVCDLGYLHALGLAQLQAKKLEQARETYQIALPYLSNDTELQSKVIKDLESLKRNRSELIPAINTIITTIR